MHGLGDRAKKGSDFGNQLRGTAQFSDPVDDGAADDDSIGEGGNLAGLLGVGDTKADTDGKGGGFFQEANFFTEGSREVLLHAGDAFAGDIIDESGGRGDEGADAGFGGGGSDENDPSQVASRGKVVGGFLGGKVEKEESIGAGSDGIGFKLLPAVGENRVVVGKENERDVAFFVPEPFDEFQDSGQGGAGFEGALATKLVDDAVGQGIGKGNAEFDQVGASFCQGGDQSGGRLEVGIAGHKIGDEGFSLLFFEAGKEFVDPVGGVHVWGDIARVGRGFTRENRFRRTQGFGGFRPANGCKDGRSRPSCPPRRGLFPFRCGL